MSAATRSSRMPGALELLVLSFLSLFLEVLLIRWIGVEIRIFAYFRNLTLISCFLGLGIGFSLKKFRPGILFSLVLILILAVLVHPRAELFGVSLRQIPNFLAFPDYNVWYAPGQATLGKMAAGYALLALVVVLLAGVMIPLGRLLGEIFAASAHRLRDYSLNVAGSLAGTWAFTLLSLLSTPPAAWFLLAAGLMAALVRPRGKKTLAAAGMLVLLLLLTTGRETPDRLTQWSPYQKLELLEEVNTAQGPAIHWYRIDVNSVSYMLILDLSPAMFERYPTVFRREEAGYYPYDLPYRFHPAPLRVLVAGAGGGNDVAAALRNGAREVDAVEIDPLIARLGLRYHRERPYSDPRVRLILDDARAFFHQTPRQYDLIIFALLDSHTLLSNFANINLDSYVYTLESLTEAKKHLAPGGVLALSFFAQEHHLWVGTKLYYLLEKAFGAPPLMLDNFGREQVHGTGGILFLAGDPLTLRRQILADPKLAGHVSQNRITPAELEKALAGGKLELPTDDWPYLYLKQRQIPNLYYLLILVLAGLMLAAIRWLFPAGRLGPSHFFLLGAGFMLVEVHSISKAALLFGSTWMVNVAIISAILVMILLANGIVLRFQLQRMSFWYLGLFASLACSYLVPVDRLLLGDYWSRGLLAGALYALPLFFAGVIFASSIQRVRALEAAFAANLLGTTLGGMLESASFVWGMKAVVLIALGLYLASAVALRRLPVREPAEPQRPMMA